MGYPTALTAKTWGFYDASFRGNSFTFQREYGSYVMENILFKISFPAEFHSQTAVEAAMTLHSQLASKGLSSSDIKKVTIRTHEACVRIIDKKGPLNNPADRDHCIQYMVAVPLIFGRLTARDYEDDVASDARIDGTVLDEVAVEYPIGHARRRKEGIPLLIEKFKINLNRIYDKGQQDKILALSLDYEKLSSTPVNEFMDMLARP